MKSEKSQTADTLRSQRSSPWCAETFCPALLISWGCETLFNMPHPWHWECGTMAGSDQCAPLMLEEAEVEEVKGLVPVHRGGTHQAYCKKLTLPSREYVKDPYGISFSFKQTQKYSFLTISMLSQLPAVCPCLFSSGAYRSACISHDEFSAGTASASCTWCRQQELTCVLCRTRVLFSAFLSNVGG